MSPRPRTATVVPRGRLALAGAALVLVASCGGPALPSADRTPQPEEPATRSSSTDDGPTRIDPVWVIDDFAGSIRVVEVADGAMFLAGSRPEGFALYRADLESRDIDWVVEELDLAIELLAADGEGGVLAVSGNTVIAYGADGQERWSAVPLRAREGGASAGITSIAVDGESVLVGGDVYGAAAELSLADGQGRWFLLQDETVTDAATFLGAGESVVALPGGTALLAGGSAGDYTVVSVDRAGGEVLWTRQTDVPPRAALGDDVLVLRESQTSLIAVDPVTGDELWRVEDDTWQNDSLAGPPAFAGDAVIARTITTLIGWDADSGAQRWTTDDRAVLPVLTSPVQHDDRLVGLLGANTLIAIDAEGDAVAAQFWEGVSGTVEILAVEGDRAVVAGRASTNQQPSQIWLLDLTELE